MTFRGLLPVLLLCPFAGSRGQDLDHPLHIGGPVRAPVLVQQVEPDISRLGEAERRRSHSVSVFLIVDTDGLPKRIRLVGRSKTPELDAAVLAAVRQYRFRPATRDGQAVAVDMFLDTDIDLF